MDSGSTRLCFTSNVFLFLNCLVEYMELILVSDLQPGWRKAAGRWIFYPCMIYLPPRSLDRSSTDQLYQHVRR